MICIASLRVSPMILILLLMSMHMNGIDSQNGLLKEDQVWAVVDRLRRESNYILPNAEEKLLKKVHKQVEEKYRRKSQEEKARAVRLKMRSKLPYAYQMALKSFLKACGEQLYAIKRHEQASIVLCNVVNNIIRDVGFRMYGVTPEKALVAAHKEVGHFYDSAFSYYEGVYRTCEKEASDCVFDIDL